MTKSPFLFLPSRPLTPEALEEINKSFSYLSHSAAIGKSVDSRETIRIGDAERRAGLYILGGPGTGKTELIKSLILQDIENGHGVFFLDPHGDAVDELIQRVPEARVNDVISLDVRDREYSFAINLLACRDISDISEREDAFTIAKNVFNKLWENMLDEKPWLQLITQQALRVFIENPDYTLSELPLFLTNTDFRNELINRTRYYPDARHFWRQEYNPKQKDATLTRARTILGDTYFRHIVSQKTTTIDFSELMDQRKILFVKLSATLSLDSKKFIGTTLVSALVHAVLNRGGVPPDKRHQFCVFVDEMQNFTTSDDFAVLFTQARKFGIATTIAHQDRYGQLGDNRPLAGATAGAGNKVVFLLTVNDAQEFAPAFANPPPSDTKPEREMVICQEPVAYLLRGHANPDVRRFVNENLRVMQERREDIKEDMEGIRIERLDDLDEAALYRLDERGSGLYREYAAQEDALRRAEGAILQARGKTAKLLYLFERGKGLRLLIRALNHFLTAVMEGRIAPGEEAFSDFLIEHVRNSRSVPEERRRALELYISLAYGNPEIPRTIPLEFAKTYGFFSQDVAETYQAVAEKRKATKRVFLKNDLNKWHQSNTSSRWRKKYTVYDPDESDVQNQITSWRVPSDPRMIWNAKWICEGYIYWSHYEWLRARLMPYLGARFESDWQVVIKNIDNVIVDVCKGIAILSKKGYLQDPRHPGSTAVLQESVANELTSFISRYREGAFVVFSILNAGTRGGIYYVWNPKQRHRYMGLYGLKYVDDARYRWQRANRDIFVGQRDKRFSIISIS